LWFLGLFIKRLGIVENKKELLQLDLDKASNINTHLITNLQQCYSDNDRLERTNISLKSESEKLKKQVKALNEENLILQNKNYTLQNDLEESWKIAKLNCKFSQSSER
jgi:FtsZ-binding cell division protein ZapB